MDIFIAPFVNSADAILELKSMMGEKGKRIAIIANIQTNNGLKHFDDILQVSDLMRKLN